LLARALAEFMFGSEEALLQLDMSEYMEKHTVSRMVGAPPGYIGYDEGGQLSERVRRRPYSVVLFDEIEKAHPDVFNMLLQILEDGNLTDNFGRRVDFRNAIIIMTSNVGATLIRRQGSMGFTQQDVETNYEAMKKRLREQVEKRFRPEFLNRLDDVIVFRPLEKEDLYDIVEIELEGVRKRLAERGLDLELTQAAKEYLIEKGYNPDFGARPLRRIIERDLEDHLAERILGGGFKAPSVIVVEADDNGLTFSRREPEKPEGPQETEPAETPGPAVG
jgi:ATP-dependent Clp protease ATP-binding subunit ClpC